MYKMKSKPLKQQVRGVLTSSIAILTLFSSANTTAAESALNGILSSGELKFCFESGYIPFEMTDKSGRYVGFDIDLAKQMARAINVKFVPVNTAWDGIVPALKTGKCDFIGGMTITPERNLSVSFADPYIEVGQTILLSPKLSDKIHSFRDLNNEQYVISTQMGTTGAEAAKKYLSGAKIDLYDTSADAVLQIANGQADAFVYDFPYNAIYEAQHQDKVVHLNESFTFEPLGWAVRQGDPDFLNFLNNFLRQIKGDGTYQRIHDKWFKSDKWVDSVQ